MTSQTEQLTDRVVVVLGGTGGIGSEVVAACAAQGASVALVGRSSVEAESMAAGIRSDGGAASGYAVEITDGRAVAELVARIDSELGPVFGLVNCAAVMANGGFLETPDEVWDEIIATNLSAVVFACRAVLPGMIAAGGGSIVNVSSRLAETGAADAAVYASSKAAVVTLTRSLAAEFGPSGIRLNVVAPGTVATKMGKAVIDSPEGADRRTRIPLRRFVTATEVADAIVFLLTDAAAGVTGQTIRVNAGELMG
jgi:NAD(P)-dependent dehydrogenase (short-subunit alcohol dehydrogenase family)